MTVILGVSLYQKINSINKPVILVSITVRDVEIKKLAICVFNFILKERMENVMSIV